MSSILSIPSIPSMASIAFAPSAPRAGLWYTRAKPPLNRPREGVAMLKKALKIAAVVLVVLVVALW
ncbi:MAG TPA: hypothetical protein PL005_17570, partial [Candidatus Hydrogenedentes bacterium]|nr:hypothetical protein [Candidatus Hydrogenedentota bacterium]